jgi:hypothetical protein
MPSFRPVGSPCDEANEISALRRIFVDPKRADGDI